MPENVPYRCRADNRRSRKMLDSGAVALPWVGRRLSLDTRPRLAQPRVRHEDTREISDDDPDDRAADGAGAEPAHVPPDGEDSRLRGAGERALQEREDAGAGPSLRRRGSRGGRRVRGVAPRRL